MSGPFELQRSYYFEAAHHLPRAPEGHRCRRLHGHSYRIDITVAGIAGEATGWVMDFADIDAVVEPICAQLDHQILNDIAGLENSTSELLAVWLWGRLVSDLPDLTAVGVAETRDSACIYRGPMRQDLDASESGAKER